MEATFGSDKTKAFLPNIKDNNNMFLCLRISSVECFVGREMGADVKSYEKKFPGIPPASAAFQIKMESSPYYNMVIVFAGRLNGPS